MISPALRRRDSWAVANFDIKDPSLVLYYPLWYPYSDMTKTSIYSYDKNRYTGSVTGAVWGSTGRTFDGGDDVITFSSAVLDLNNNFTVIVWANPTDGASAVLRPLVWWGQDAAGKRRELGVSDDDGHLWFSGYGGAANIESATNVFGGYKMLTLTLNSSNNVNLLVNGASVFTGSPALAAYTYGGTKIGASATAGEFAMGTIGEVLIYNKVLASGELFRIYDATKWRYA